MVRVASAIGSVRVTLVGVALVTLAGSASAQEPLNRQEQDSRTFESIRLDARAGLAIPTADMRNFVDEGFVVGAGVSYRLSPRFSARADWTASFMPAADRRPFRVWGAKVPAWGSETNLHHLTGGAQVEVSEPGRAAVEVRLHAGLGLTFLSTEETELAVGGDFTQFTMDTGLELAVPLGDDIRFIGRADVYVLPFRSGGAPHLLKEVTLPVSWGLAVGL